VVTPWIGLNVKQPTQNLKFSDWASVAGRRIDSNAFIVAATNGRQRTFSDPSVGTEIRG